MDEAESDERDTNISNPEKSVCDQLAPSTRCYQKRILGIPCAAVFVGLGGGAMLLGVTRQLIGEDWLGAHGFQYAGSIGPWPFHEQALEDITHVGGAVASHFELLGLFGVDFILKGRNVWPLEVNPRYTASVEVVERFTGIPALAAHKLACVGSQDVYTFINSADRSHSLPTCHGKATLFARRDITISRHFAEMALREALVTPWPTLADVPPVETPIAAGRPIITVFAAGQNVDEVEQRLRSRVADLEQQIYTGEVPS
jgi:predicted ATP-grasp superfamily ATP-dependent carboligase